MAPPSTCPCWSVTRPRRVQVSCEYATKVGASRNKAGSKTLSASTACRRLHLPVNVRSSGLSMAGANTAVTAHVMPLMKNLSYLAKSYRSFFCLLSRIDNEGGSECIYPAPVSAASEFPKSSGHVRVPADIKGAPVRRRRSRHWTRKVSRSSGNRLRSVCSRPRLFDWAARPPSTVGIAACIQRKNEDRHLPMLLRFQRGYRGPANCINQSVSTFQVSLSSRHRDVTFLWKS
jgi:hypothetical protein